MRKNLSHEQIISAALEELEDGGFESLSLRRIALRVGVKPASLYNHLDGIDGIRVGVAIRAAGELEARLIAATNGVDRDTAFLGGCMAYRAFATERPELYHAYISTRGLDDERVHEAGKRSFAPLVKLIRSYGLDEYETQNFHRALRSAIHGFIELCNNGFMTQGPTSRDESYRVMILEYLRALHTYSPLGKENEE